LRIHAPHPARPHLQLSVLEALVLQHLLDGDQLARLDDRRLKHNAEAAIANHAVGHELQGEFADGRRCLQWRKWW